MTEPIKLNLGAGGVEVAGFIGVDIKEGQSAYPLPDYADGSVDEIRASHILEHFGQAEAAAVLDEWVRVLKPGGIIRIAVPDFELIAQAYAEHTPVAMPDDEAHRQEGMLMAYVMGGQVDEHDFHRSAWSSWRLRLLMESAALQDIWEWESDVADCASYPISLNLQGRKRTADEVAAMIESGEATEVPAGDHVAKIAALMSCPRVGFLDHVFCVIDGLLPLGCIIKRHHGAFWGQGLTNLIEQSIEEGCDFVVTVDYDTIFQPEDARFLVETIASRPDMDALCAVQIKREVSAPLCTVLGPDGEVAKEMPLSVFAPPFTRLASAHFGLTVLRCSAFEAMELPWFHGHPGPDGRWHEGRRDEDINFWRKWRDCGNTLFQANRVALGHIQMMATWPTPEFGAVHQYLHDYASDGKPEGV